MAAQPATPKIVNVLLFGCGEPNKAMGWFHATQLLQDSRVRLVGLVEPWFLGAGSTAPGVEAFRAFRGELAAAYPEAVFVADASELPSQRGAPSLALIATRTREAPSHFHAACALGVSHVYLEKPGAETSEQLQHMIDAAAAQGVQVVVGYNKNVSKYCRNAMTELRLHSPAPAVVLEHNNAMARGEDVMVFLRGPGAEGMVHNMCCHELAMAVVLLGLRRAKISSLTMDPSQCELVDLGEGRSDWLRLGFSLKLKETEDGHPTEIRFRADRCGGNFSRIHIGDVGRFQLPDDEHAAWIEQEQASKPDMRAYFFLQAPDYLRLKGMLIDHIIAGSAGIPAGAASLENALEVLMLADFLAPMLQTTWQAGSPWSWLAEAA